MSFEIKDDEMLWHHDGKTDIIFVENLCDPDVTLNYPSGCPAMMEDISDIVFQKDFSSAVEWDFKRKLVLAMFLDNPEDEKTCAYIRKKFANIFSWCIDENKTNTAKALINSGNFMTKRNVQKWIQYAIDNQAHEVYLLLTEYKKQNLGYQEITKKLKL